MEDVIKEKLGMEIKSMKMLATVMLILGLIALFFPVMIAGIVVFMIAFILILMGGMYLSLAIYGEENEKNWITWVKAFVILGIGLLMLTNAQASAAAIALLLGIFFFAAAFMVMLISYDLYPEKGWHLFFMDGIIAILLAIIIFIGWPEQSAVLLGLLLGVDLIVEGITIMVIASHYEKNMTETEV